ncbi:multidrug efflux RND transporter permease subunit [bacterium]|nr:multidrug efflux RND transporter permease subunit [bacterium]
MFARFFVDRPIFATVLSVVIVIIGLVALTQLPIAQYPEVAPPVVQVTASYPGANAITVSETVATPIELEVNGVERMLYMASRCTNDGQMILDVTFELGTNLDMAQVLVQNRVSVAQAKLPEEVKKIGVTTKKKSPSILLAVNLISPDNRYDQLYLSNFAALNVKDDLARIKGVGDVTFLGPRDYSMRIWLDPEKLAARDMTASDVLRAISEQNVQVAAGRIGQPPISQNTEIPFQLAINTQGRLVDPGQFADIILKRGERGQLVYLRDVVRDPTMDDQGHVVGEGVELGAKNYDVNTYLDGQPSVALAVFQLPGSNALQTATAIRAKLEELKAKFPEGVEYRIHYDTTVFVEESIASVYHTLIEAFILVFVVVIVFLQDWRATLMPMIDVPVSLIGTFAVMALMGFSLNNLSLFGLVLAIGIVVDDAIVVVENIERWMSKGLAPREAVIKAMDEITGPVIAITLVLSSVFIPTAFIAGITGQFYKQFALTIATSTIISAINAMTMAPARAVTLIKPHHAGGPDDHREALPRWGVVLLAGYLAYRFLTPWLAPMFGLEASAGGHGHASSDAVSAELWGLRIVLFALGGIGGWFAFGIVNRILIAFFDVFNRVFGVLTKGYGLVVRGVLRTAIIMLVVYVGLLGATYWSSVTIPQGFIPEQDKGYLVVNAQLPDGASLERTDALIRKMSTTSRKVPGVAHTLDLAGYSPILGTNLSNAGGMFVILEPFEERTGNATLSARAVTQQLRKAFSEFPEAQIAVFGAPPVDGIGSTGGFKLQVEDRRGAGLRALQGSVQSLREEGLRDPRLVGLFSTFSVTQPQVFVDIDREKARAIGVPLQEIYTTLQAYLGAAYVNDFTFQNRSWQVNVQADPRFRMHVEDIGKLQVRTDQGQRVPLQTLINVRLTSGPAIVNRYKLYPSAEITGATAPGTSTGQAVSILNELSNRSLPETMGIEWTELTFQQILASQDLLTKIIFPLAVLFVFLVLSAQYESWALPLAIILIVPLCILAAMIGVWLTGLDNNIFVQIGLVVLVGLAAKNAILIVEYAKQLQDEGQSLFNATVEACQLRLRPILMTSFAFILGVVPLVRAEGAGAEMRSTLGIAVFSGMLGVTLFGVLLTPVFFYVIRWLGGHGTTIAPPPVTPAITTPAATELPPPADSPAEGH